MPKERLKGTGSERYPTRSGPNISPFSIISLQTGIRPCDHLAACKRVHAMMVMRRNNHGHYVRAVQARHSHNRLKATMVKSRTDS